MVKNGTQFFLVLENRNDLFFYRFYRGLELFFVNFSTMINLYNKDYHPFLLQIQNNSGFSNTQPIK